MNSKKSRLFSMQVLIIADWLSAISASFSTVSRLPVGGSTAGSGAGLLNARLSDIVSVKSNSSKYPWAASDSPGVFVVWYRIDPFAYFATTLASG